MWLFKHRKPLLSIDQQEMGIESEEADKRVERWVEAVGSLGSATRMSL